MKLMGESAATPPWETARRSVSRSSSASARLEAQSCYVDYEPSFGRGPFGHYICTAVNDAVLHGLPYHDAFTDHLF